MCVISMVGDAYRDQFQMRWPNVTVYPPFVPRGEFDDLKKEVESLKELLIAAKKFDQETGQPDCEMADKVEMIKKIASMVGVDLSDVFSK